MTKNETLLEILANLEETLVLVRRLRRQTAVEPNNNASEEYFPVPSGLPQREWFADDAPDDRALADWLERAREFRSAFKKKEVASIESAGEIGSLETAVKSLVVTTLSLLD